MDITKAPNPNPGDVLVVRGSGIAQAGVRFWTDSIIDHAACCIGDDNVIDARPWHGVSEHTFVEWEKEPWILLTPKPELILSKSQIKAGLAWLRNQNGKGYDWGGVIGFPLNNPDLHNPKKWYCSALVRGWYMSMGVNIVERTPISFTSPQSVLESLRFDIKDHNLTDEKLLQFIQQPVLPTFKRRNNR